MSFREELAQIMAESANLVYTEDELETFTTNIKEICRNRAKNNDNWAYINCCEFEVVRNGKKIIPRINEQIFQLFYNLGLDVEFLSVQNVYSVSWESDHN